MTTMPVDPRMAMDAANAQDLVQRKVAVDSLRHRLGDTRTQEEKLRETCEGFESIFVQKMWEQMRKNVKKEGYLHSKDEEFYQSMFDQELAKKMTSAGGIGLAAMLEQQLSQRLNHSSRSTTGSGVKAPLAPASSAAAPKIPVEELYTAVEEEPAPQVAPAIDPVLTKALTELDEERQAAAVQESAAEAQTQPVMLQAPLQGVAQVQGAAQAAATLEAERPERAIAPQPMPAKVYAPGKSRPVRRGASRSASGRSVPTQNAGRSPAAAFSPAIAPGGNSGANVNTAVPGANAQPQQGAGVYPPVQGSISSGYGWKTEEGGSGKSWHTGVDIQAREGDAVVAMQAGTVIFAGEQDGYGHLMVLEHEGGMRSYYGNAKADGVSVGDAVDSGKKIASIAMQSNATVDNSEAHLHFEVRRGELAVNPQTLIQTALNGNGATAGQA